MSHQTWAMAILIALVLFPPPAAGQSMRFRVLEQKQEKKGGARYVLLIAKAALTEAHADLSKPKVEATLRELLRTLREDVRRSGSRADGITAFLYQSRDHLEGGSAALGRAEWWPKGHSFDATNAANIENKALHEETVEVFALPQSARSVVSRLPETTRREIYTNVVRAQDRAGREAEAEYPTDASTIPIDRLRSYDWNGALKKNAEESARLRKQYEAEVLSKYKISDSELGAIKREGFAQQWPLPPLR